MLAGSSVLEPTVNKAGVSLLYPGGITVNPTNHQILIAGYIDRGKLVNEEKQRRPSRRSNRPAPSVVVGLMKKASSKGAAA